MVHELEAAAALRTAPRAARRDIFIYVVQAGVMWNVVYNPIERVIAPVIRGNPWG